MAVPTYSNFVVSGSNPAESGRIFNLLTISGGDIYTGDIVQWLTLATNGTNAVNTTGRVAVQAAYNKVYFADGDPAHYKHWTLATDTVAAWTLTGGTLPMGSDETAADLTAATPGTPSFTVLEDWSDRAAGDHLLVAGSTANDGYYTIANVAGTGPTVLTVNEAVPDNTVDGTIQYQNKACTINTLYRGRLVMAGLCTDPHNWFMSKVNDPLDFDYNPADPNEKQAVAGNNTEAGKAGDIVTCLAPFSDDLMFMGGDHTLWIMRGDPAAAGRIDNISYQIGISGPDAFTFDPNGVFYFFGTGQLWRVSPEVGAAPESVSSGRLDALFRAIDLTTHTVHLHWSNDLRGLFLFIVPTTSAATTHYFWDQQTDSFWKIVFPNDTIATAYPFDGDHPDDSRLLLGGWDGYIRSIDRAATSDDGTAISSYVIFPPINLGGMRRNTKLTRFELLMDEDSDDVIISVYAGENTQKVLDLEKLCYSRTVTAGRNDIINRAMGNVLAIRIANSVLSTRWAMEEGSVQVSLAGPTRKGSL